MNREDWLHFSLAIVGLVTFFTGIILLPQAGLYKSTTIIEIATSTPLIATVISFGIVCGFTGATLLKTKHTLRNPETKNEAYTGLLIALLPAIIVLLYIGIGLAVTLQPNFYLIVAYISVSLYIITSFASGYVIKYGSDQFYSKSKPRRKR